MSSRRRNPQTSFPPLSFRLGPRTPGSSRRPSDTDPTVVTLARSARSSATTTRSFHDAQDNLVQLPLTLFEYGFPDVSTRVLLPNDRFPAGKATDFMNSEAGRQLRSLEREYTRVFNQFVNRSVRLAQARILILGSGASKVVSGYLARGISLITFVDVDQTALDHLRAHIQTTGLDARAEVEYVCSDALAFLSDADDQSYDVVIATKCVGLILGGDPDRTEETLFDSVSDVLAADGSFFTDHHIAYATPASGFNFVRDTAGDQYDLATVCGRYSSDRCYTWADIQTDDLRLVTSYAPHRSQTYVQCWEMFHFRARTSTRFNNSQVLSPPVIMAPGVVPVSDVGIYDKMSDALVPINNKGVKRVVTPDDLAAFDITTTRVKLDGTPGILQLLDRVAIFVSSTRTFSIELDRGVSIGLTLMAELVRASTGGHTLFVTGVVAVGDSPADPLDYEALRAVLPTLRTLRSSGIVANTPDLTQSLRANAVEMTDGVGRVVRYPVDGVQVTTAGRSGVFIKPGPLNTIDSTNADIVRLVTRASDALGLPTPGIVEPSAHEGVWEYALSRVDKVWRPVRLRPDKTRSDGLGAAIHTLAAAISADGLGLGETVADVLKATNR